MKRNRWEIMGHLGADARTGVTNGGKAVANLSVAVNEGFKGEGGVWQERTLWVQVECWGRSYHYASNLKKGEMVSVEGKLKITAPYEQDGIQKQGFVLVTDSIFPLKKGDTTNDIEGVEPDELPAPDTSFHTL
jgi:single-strand DNA-binding protein